MGIYATLLENSEFNTVISLNWWFGYCGCWDDSYNYTLVTCIQILNTWAWSGWAGIVKVDIYNPWRMEMNEGSWGPQKETFNYLVSCSMRLQMNGPENLLQAFYWQTLIYVLTTSVWWYNPVADVSIQWCNNCVAVSGYVNVST